MPSLPATKQSKAAKAVAARAAAERQASNQSAEASALGRRGRPMGSDSDIGGTSRTNQQNVRNVCIGWAHLYDPYKPHPTSDFTPRGWAGRGGGGWGWVRVGSTEYLPSRVGPSRVEGGA